MIPPPATWAGVNLKKHKTMPAINELMKTLEGAFACPKTGSPLNIDWKASVVCCADSAKEYPIKDGIIDFIPEVNDEISASYDALSSQYDAYMTSSNPGWKMVNWITWGFSDDKKYALPLLKNIPDDFEGILLDVPFGTGILTLGKYRKMQKAGIIAIDYSMGMLRQAKKWCEQQNIHNVIFARADVGSLPLRDAVVDGCLCMNGFHIFPDKMQAMRELARVIRSDGNLACCFYTKGKRKLTDILVNAVLQKRGAFMPPYYCEEEVLSIFKSSFDIVTKGNLKSIFYFDSRRK